MPSTIRSPDDPALAELTAELAKRSAELDTPGAWPADQLVLCGEYGVYEWFLEPSFGGQAWSPADICRGYLALSAACLTTTFVITQRMGACQRIAASDNTVLHKRLLGDLIAGRTFATVGISHLTTSRQHLGRPVLRAEQTSTGFRLNGYSPWITGAVHAHHLVIGATLDDGRQILAVVPTDLPGVRIPPALSLVGLSASHTGPAHFENVELPSEWVLAGPAEDVMKRGTGANTGGLQTSTLALGLATTATEYLEREATKRGELDEATQALRRELDETIRDLLAVAEGNPVCSNEQLRARANSLVLRASQAALVAAKGAGYVIGHPAGRWCREALFFLVWSCPQNVMSANLCELAGIED